VTTDPTHDRRDQYGRLLAYVASARGSFGAAQLRAGWARVSVSEKPFMRVATFEAAEASARKASRGIWAQCGENGDTEGP
jgi:endonuclease YncB( thermonuclease family)